VGLKLASVALYRVFVFEDRENEQILGSPTCNNGQDEALVFPIILHLKFAEACILQRSMSKRFHDALCLLNSLVETGDERHNVLDKELDSMGVTGDEKAVFEILKLLDFDPHTSHCCTGISRDRVDAIESLV